jgi:hypothetical protein
MGTPEISNLTGEKITISVIIGILLFTLVYMSSYTLIIRDENEKFKQSIKTVNAEIDLLLNFLPQKDSVIHSQEQQIIEQIKTIQIALNDKETTQQEKEILIERLNRLKREALQLKEELLEVQEYASQAIAQQTAAAAGFQAKDVQLQAYAQEIQLLKEQILTLQNRKSETIVQSPLSAFYFTAQPSDSKNRHLRTTSVKIKLQLRGDLLTTSCRYLKVQVIDPNNRVISSPSDQIRASTELMTEYTFSPMNYRFIKGRYSVRIYCEDFDFQTVTFFQLS